MLAPMQACTPYTSTHSSVGVFAWKPLCKERSKFDPGFAASKVLLLIKPLKVCDIEMRQDIKMQFFIFMKHQ